MNTNYQLINQRINEIATERNFKVLFACETGSRGWGFASPDSDFDIRFVYVYAREKYLMLTPPPDTFSLMETINGEVLDFSGWDLRKFLQLARRSNASIFEWLQSPIIYYELPYFQQEVWNLVVPHFRPRSFIYHYLGICHNSLKTGIEGESIGIKKYFYVLRPLLAAAWAAHKGTIPPMQFKPLLDQIVHHDALFKTIIDLWAAKELAIEGKKIPLIPVIQDWVTHEMEHLKQLAANYTENVQLPDDALNALFLKYAI